MGQSLFVSMDGWVELISWYHLLAAADVLLVTLGVAAFIAVSRKRIPPAIPLTVTGPYIEPGAECVHFAQTWKSRWQGSPNHVELFTFPDGQTCTVRKCNLSKSTFVETRGAIEKDIALSQYIANIENSSKLVCTEEGDTEQSSQQTVLRRYFRIPSDHNATPGRRQNNTETCSPVCTQCEREFAVSFTHLNSLRRYFPNTLQSLLEQDALK